MQRGWSLSSFSTGVSPRRASPRCAHIQTAPSLSHPEALSFVSAAENGRRLEMDLKLRGAGDSTRSSGTGYCMSFMKSVIDQFSIFQKSELRVESPAPRSLYAPSHFTIQKYKDFLDLCDSDSGVPGVPGVCTPPVISPLKRTRTFRAGAKGRHVAPHHGKLLPHRNGRVTVA